MAVNQSITNLCDGTFKSGILKGLPCDKPVQDINTFLTLTKTIVTNFLLPAVGTIFVIMIIFGGLQYITSAGNESRVEGAKKTLTTAIIGLLLIILAEIIVGVFANFLGGGIIK